MATQDDDLAGLSDESKHLLQVLEARTKALVVAEIKHLSTGVQRQLDAISRNIDDLIVEATDDIADEDDEDEEDEDEDEEDDEPEATPRQGRVNEG
jgi:hypothetical protein